MQRVITYLSEHVSARSVVQVVLASLILGLCSQIKVPLPFTPVPVSLQTFFMLLVGGVLGARKGALAVALYVLEATAGLPFFLGGGSGISHLTGITCGYIFGFIMQAFIAGLYVDYAKKFSSIRCFLAFSAASAVQLLMGALWLSLFMGFESAFVKGVVPFIGVAFLKVVMAIPIVAGSRRLLSLW